jgi:hypothetical protein
MQQSEAGSLEGMTVSHVCRQAGCIRHEMSIGMRWTNGVTLCWRQQSSDWVAGGVGRVVGYGGYRRDPLLDATVRDWVAGGVDRVPGEPLEGGSLWNRLCIGTRQHVGWVDGRMSGRCSCRRLELGLLTKWSRGISEGNCEVRDQYPHVS